VTATSAQSFSAEALVPPPTDGWRTNGGNLFNQRYSPLDQINRENVRELKGVWQARLNGSGVGPRYSGEAQPIVHDGVIYMITGADDVFALSVESGEILWSYEALLDQTINTICCGWLSRGVGLGDGRVYVGQLDGKLVALDQETGDILWAVQGERWQDGYVITSAPLYYDGLVITGFAGAEYAQRGRVKAYDASSGALVWTFYTVPAPGEFGSETWPEDSSIWRYGGGSVWHTPAADPELGLIYFSTGNAGPDFNGAVRPGDNLFTSSVVALDALSGEYRWHYQMVHHDIWDYDMPTPIVLFDREIDGVPRRGRASTGKTGWVYLLDRETGEPLIGTIDIPPEGYTLVNGGRIFTPFLNEGVVMKPAQTGGANWAPSSYDVETGLYYVCAKDQIGMFRGGPTFNAEPEAGDRVWGGIFGGVAIPETGIFAAIDVTTNRVAWSQRWPERCYSGSVTTAGGLVFVGRNDGRLTALDASSGRRLWQFQTGAGMNSPVSVFEHEGEQYIVANAAGNLFAGSTRGDRVWLFSLSGTLGPAVPDAPNRGGGAAAAQTDSDDAQADADVEVTQGLYAAACQACHGENGEGGHNGVAYSEDLDVETVVRIVTQGRNNMPPFEDALTSTQIRDLAEYISGALLAR
jgi:alcohol dehydrogenase (cytochrome c)